MNMINWKKYDRSDNNLIELIHRATTDESIKFKILMDDFSRYDCTLQQSINFRGLAYIKAVDPDNGNVYHFSVGDDNIKSWDYFDNNFDDPMVA